MITFVIGLCIGVIVGVGTTALVDGKAGEESRADALLRKLEEMDRQNTAKARLN